MVYIIRFMSTAPPGVFTSLYYSNKVDVPGQKFPFITNYCLYTIYCIQYTIYEHAFANICSFLHNHTQSSRAAPCQIIGAAKKLRLMAVQQLRCSGPKELRLRRIRGSCVACRFNVAGAAKELRRFMRAQNLTLKIKF